MRHYFFDKQREDKTYDKHLKKRVRNQPEESKHRVFIPCLELFLRHGEEKIKKMSGVTSHVEYYNKPRDKCNRLMIQSALYYLTHHPLITGQWNIDRSYFPSDARIQPMIINTVRDMRTPFFLMDTKMVKDRISNLLNAVSRYWHNQIISYSFKTNYAPISFMRLSGLAAEVTSERELDMAIRFRFRGENIVFNGPHKSDHALAKAMKLGVMVHIDNSEELYRIDSLTKRVKKKIHVGCRVNMSRYGCVPSHFGFYERELFSESVLSRFHPRSPLSLSGIHVHIGTDIEHVEAFADVGRRVGLMVRALHTKGFPVTHLDVGGGAMSHGLAPYSKRRWEPYDIDEYVSAWWKGLVETYPRVADLTMITEPGRYLVDDATVFVSRVLRTKQHGVNQTIFVDATTAMVPLVNYRPQIIRVFEADGKVRNRRWMPTIIYGASCREDDVLFRGWLPAMTKGNIIVLYCVGAYNETLGVDFIYKKPRTVFL